MNIREAIVLAGGLGTRLREAVPDLPKCMAPVNGKPFLHYLLSYFEEQGIERFLLSVGYKHDLISEYFTNLSHDFDLTYVVENEPLGTGGGIQLAMQKVISKNVLVLNGDTFFNIDLNRFSGFHLDKGAECSLALKPMKNFDRYGVVETDADQRIISFKEKRPYEEGSINGGVYAIDKTRFLARNLPQQFSMEKDYFERVVDEGCLYGQPQDRYFIDIGIPADYNRVQKTFLPLTNYNAVIQTSMLNLSEIDKDWTLFLDRDGVLNVELHLDYVKKFEEFQFMPGVLEALKTLASVFQRIVIVTNQRGIGRGLMTDEDLSDIHARMMHEIISAGGRIDKIYYCSALDNADINRKPNPGMAFKAKSDIPGIDLNKAIIVGNNISDMEFGRNAGIYTVHVRTTHPDIPNPHPMIDLSCSDLPEFTQFLVNALAKSHSLHQ